MKETPSATHTLRIVEMDFSEDDAACGLAVGALDRCGLPLELWGSEDRRRDCSTKKLSSAFQYIIDRTGRLPRAPYPL
jgi:hypothetical protein